MKTISVAISEADYESLRNAAQKEGRSVAQLIHEVTARYCEEKLKARLKDLPLFSGHEAVDPLPDRGDVYEEIWTLQADRD